MYINCLVVSLLSLITVIHGKWVWQEDKSSPEEERNSISFSDIISVQKQVKDQVSSIENTSSNGGELASILDVHHPDSPYGLIQDVLKQQKPVTDNFLPSAADLGGLDAKEVWLSQGDLLVLKGGITNTDGEAKWPPLDDYQAPYREPILAPTTNTLSKVEGILSILPAPANFQSQRLPRNFFLPSLQEPKVAASTPSPRQTSAQPGFVPITPSWLQSSSSTPAPKYHTSGYPRTFGRSTPPPSIQYWAPQPVLTQVQRPASFQRPPPRKETNFITVKHGLYPLIKSRWRQFNQIRRPRRFFYRK